MITEDYVSFETAKLLKEKRFDWEVHRSYLVNDNCFAPADVNDLPYRKDAIRIPTLQMAMKWLREVHKIIITIDYDDDSDCEDNERYGFSVYCPSRKVDLATYATYEEACEEAIKHCLKYLIQ